MLGMGRILWRATTKALARTQDMIEIMGEQHPKYELRFMPHIATHLGNRRLPISKANSIRASQRQA
jgi:hypothetical protein